LGTAVLIMSQSNKKERGKGQKKLQMGNLGITGGAGSPDSGIIRTGMGTYLGPKSLIIAGFLTGVLTIHRRISAMGFSYMR
jgi:hypothetical protein